MHHPAYRGENCLRHHIQPCPEYFRTTPTVGGYVLFRCICLSSNVKTFTRGHLYQTITTGYSTPSQILGGCKCSFSVIHMKMCRYLRQPCFPYFRWGGCECILTWHHRGDSNIITILLEPQRWWRARFSSESVKVIIPTFLNPHTPFWL